MGAGVLVMIDRVRFEVEVSSDCNGSLLFTPATKKLRGAWRNSEASRFEAGKDIRQMAYAVGDIPGIRIFVDLAQDKCGYYDPLLADKRYEDLAAKLQEYLKKTPLGPSNGVSFTKAYLIEKPTPTNLKTWLHWMRQALDSKYVEVPTGKPDLPSLDDIRKMPGRRETGGNPLVDPESKAAIAAYQYIVPDDDESILGAKPGNERSGQQNRNSGGQKK
jgi:hypothetical protein